MEYFGNLHGIDRHIIKKRIEEFTEILEMEDFLDRRCSTFSKGMKQKTAVARSLIHDPEVVILDEPTSGLDLGAAKKVQDFILFMKGCGKSILFSSHNMQEIIKTADNLIIMHKGIIKDTGNKDELESKYSMNVEELFHHLTGGKK